ncbi:hypothetical protein E2562_021401 [Oryza meyeriana var. granulata]|uniref:Uncharacterized protein n=1 Tax=Oryza meyeriana var. granulata TaxID=110450 RepID=A0A6G1EXK9_9ORYZ|nr:hypothetical protein E2562_021401 [Oryza meyeriana var. granulata]
MGWCLGGMAARSSGAPRRHQLCSNRLPASQVATRPRRRRRKEAAAAGHNHNSSVARRQLKPATNRRRR